METSDAKVYQGNGVSFNLQYTTQGVVTLVFTSDHAKTDAGFLIEYTIAPY